MKPCSLKCHYLVTYTLKILLFGLVCDSCPFFSRSSVALASFFVVDIFPLRSSILSIISWVIRGPLASLFTYEKRLLASSCSSRCLLVRLHGTTRVPLDGLSWNFILRIFRKSAEKIQVSLKPDKNNGYFTNTHLWSYLVHYFLEWKILLMNFVDNIKTQLSFNTFFSIIMPFMR
jgi:hypothetical protein